jgi:uncharacterized protein RhaS with RHS repeats
VTKWTYDPYGRVTNKVDQANVEILRYKYDANDRLTNRWSKAKGNTSYKYDDVGNLTNIFYGTTLAQTAPQVSLRYDALNRVTNMVDGIGTNRYTYHPGGQLYTEDGPWDNDTVTNLCNHAAAGRLRSD